MFLLCDFAFVPMTDQKWGKVLNKWKGRVKTDNPIGKDHFNILDSIEKSGDHSNLKFLKKTYKDGNKNRNVVTGIVKQDILKKQTPDGKYKRHYNIESLAGNPKSNKDKRFKGAINSLKDDLNDQDTISIAGINKTIDKKYEDTFKNKKRDWVGNEYKWRQE